MVFLIKLAILGLAAYGCEEAVASAEKDGHQALSYIISGLSVAVLLFAAYLMFGI